MTLAYYPGCSMHGTSREYEESLLAVAAALDIQMNEIDDWSCCGASSAHAADHLLGVALPARNLALAEAQGADEVVAPCAACYNRLSGAVHAYGEEPGMAARLTEVLDRSFANTVKVLSIVELLRGLAPLIEERVAARLEPNPLEHLNIAAYYGCLLVRPAETTGFDDAERPSTMEDVIGACGARPVPWNMAVECCGGAFSVARTSSVLRLSRAIIDDARRSGADAILAACPLCHANLDFRQGAMSLRGEPPMPVLYITQLVGLALGLPMDTLGFDRHFVDTQPLFAYLAAEAEKAAAAAAEREAAKAAKAAARERDKAGAAAATAGTTGGDD
jgi:heterodisulfide reductase subunit B